MTIHTQSRNADGAELSPARADVRHGWAIRTVAFGAISLTYCMYLWFYSDLPCGFRAIGTLSVCTVFQAPLVLFPLYAAILWRWRREITPIDLNMIYLPLLVWYLAFVLVDHGKALSNFVLEPTCVGLLTGLYLVKFPLARRASPRKGKAIAAVFMLVISLLALLVTVIIPPIAD